VMVQNTAAAIRTYGLEAPATYKARFMAATVHGNELDIAGQQVWFALPGRFNAYNALAAYGVALELGEPAEEVLRILSGLKGAPGRFETLTGPTGLTAIVDYAHTPDALKNVLETIEELKEDGARIWTIIGCGGDRDTTKRPAMAAIAAKLSDKVILTSDNPRSEDPGTIIAQMAEGVPLSARQKVVREADRVTKTIKKWPASGILSMIGLRCGGYLD
jgi:UDP-N-acetylmuramoyl-L-alanyl-D-glutamate--2,6-diaminopimelate ligase